MTRFLSLRRRLQCSTPRRRGRVTTTFHFGSAFQAFDRPRTVVRGRATPVSSDCAARPPPCLPFPPASSKTAVWRSGCWRGLPERLSTAPRHCRRAAVCVAISQANRPLAGASGAMQGTQSGKVAGKRCCALCVAVRLPDCFGSTRWFKEGKPRCAAVILRHRPIIRP